jgi:hypothetical protein
MADVKTSALPAATSMAATDEFVIIADIGTVPVTKRIPQTTAIPFNLVPTADSIPLANGSGKIDLNWVVDYKNLWVSGWKPTVTSGCGAQAQIEMGTNKNVYDYLAFDKDAIEYAYANVPMPLDYDEGTITAQFYWLHPATTTNFKVSWGLQAVAITDDGTLDVAQGTAIYSNDEGGTTSDLYISTETAAITIGGTPTPGKLVQFRVSRKADDATNDTIAVDTYLLGVLIKYGVA